MSDSVMPASSGAGQLPPLPYLAGFFDGEGSIGIYGNGQGNGLTLRVQITQTVTPQSTMMLTAIRERWGGSLSPFNRTLRRSAWNWQASAAYGFAFLRDVRPWLLLKADQADVVLSWWPNRGKPQRDARGRNMPKTPEVRAADQAAAQTLKNLKKDIDIVNVKGD